MKMTPEQSAPPIQDRAAKVLQEIDDALAMAEKATPGPWEVSGRTIFHYEPGIGNRICDSYGKDSDFIAASRTLLPKSLRCLKTAIEGLLPVVMQVKNHHPDDMDRGRCPHCLALAGASTALTTICDGWEATKL